MITTLALAAPATVLAGENQKSGPIGLAVILVLCVVSYLLFRSMSRHMRKVREEFPDDAAPTGASTTAPTTVVPPLPGAGTDPARDADAATAEGPASPEDGAPA